MNGSWTTSLARCSITLEGVTSLVIEVTSGVPQGSILDPIFSYYA